VVPDHWIRRAVVFRGGMLPRVTIAGDAPRQAGLAAMLGDLVCLKWWPLPGLP